MQHARRPWACLVALLAFQAAFVDGDDRHPRGGPSGISYDLTARSILKQIEARGAEDVAQEILDDERAWDRVTSEISSGSREWLAVARHFWPVVDADFADGLGSALGEALSNAPATVLSMADEKGQSSFPLALVCGHGKETRDDVTLESLLLVLERRHRVVSSLSVPSLRAKRDRCLRHLEEGRRDVQRALDAQKKIAGGAIIPPEGQG